MPRYPRPAPSGNLGCRRGGSRQSRRVPSAAAGTHTRLTGKSASKMGSSTSFSAAWITWSAMEGIPSLRSFPDPPGLGIMRSRTGSVKNVPVLELRHAGDPGTRGRPMLSSTQATVMPSTPGVFAPRLPATRQNATISVAGSCTKLNKLSNRRPGSATAQRGSLACISDTLAHDPQVPVACHVHGTTLRGFLPRAWDHLVASDGTTRRVAPGVLITSGTDAFKSIDLGVRGMAFREVAVTEIREVLRAWLSGAGCAGWLSRRGWTGRPPAGMWRRRSRRGWPVTAGRAADDELVGQVAQAVRPGGRAATGWRGSSWRPATPRSRRW